MPAGVCVDLTRAWSLAVAHPGFRNGRERDGLCAQTWSFHGVARKEEYVSRSGRQVYRKRDGMQEKRKREEEVQNARPYARKLEKKGR